MVAANGAAKQVRGVTNLGLKRGCYAFRHGIVFQHELRRGGNVSVEQADGAVGVSGSLGVKERR
jgi:hypothetical protein